MHMYTHTHSYRKFNAVTVSFPRRICTPVYVHLSQCASTKQIDIQ